MKLRAFLAMTTVALFAGVAMADDDYKTTTEETTTTIQGEVVQMDPGKTIVVRKSGGETVTYQLTPEVRLPAEVRVGGNVVLYTDQPASRRVTKVTTSSLGPVTKRVEETTDEFGNVDTKTSYTVKSFDPGRTITLVGPDGRVMTLGVDSTSEIPVDIGIGKHVNVQTEEVAGEPVARRVIVKKTTTTTSEDEDDD